jgi:hypothetical protein
MHPARADLAGLVDADLADATVRARWDHVKYLTLSAVTLLHQHQRRSRPSAAAGR